MQSSWFIESSYRELSSNRANFESSYFRIELLRAYIESNSSESRASNILCSPIQYASHQNWEYSNNNKKVTTLVDNVSEIKFPESQEKELVNIYYIANVKENDTTTKKLYNHNFVTGENSEVQGYSYKELTLISFT